MAGFADILGSLVQNSLSGSSGSRITNAFGGTSGGLGDLMGGLGQMMGGQGAAGGQGIDLGDMLGSVLGGLGGGQGTQAGGLGNLGGLLGEVASNFTGNKAALSGLGALGGALLGGGGRAAKGAVGGGVLAVLASLAMSALKKSGQQPAQTPAAFYADPTPAQQQEMDNDAETMVRAMISAAKADGQIDQEELQRIIGKMGEDGLSEEEKLFFQNEAQAPLDLQRVVDSAAGRPEMAAQIYAASLLAIEVDTDGERQYMHRLAEGLGLAPETVQYIEETFAK